jgi:hypothetical protein
MPGAGGNGGSGGTKGNGGGGSGPSGGGPVFQGCSIFPVDNPWNVDVSDPMTFPVDPNSDTIIANINSSGATILHPDFGSNPAYGIPFVGVSGAEPKVPITFDAPDQSDPGPYPIPLDAPIEGGSDSTGNRHVIALEKDSCTLWETWDSHVDNGTWHAASGAMFDLKSNTLRRLCWTSADAAGLPVFAGLVRYDEAAVTGAIQHALRFSVERTRQAFVAPATHFASGNTATDLAPMGMRVRLKATFDISAFSGAARVILVALQRYGMFLAGVGPNWYISGSSDPRFDDRNLLSLKGVPGSAFEVVQMGRTFTAADCP